MLIFLNLLIILFLLGMAALWATYGFFSGFLQLVVVIVAGVLALAVWEPLTFWLLGRMPAYAHGVGLLAPFALFIIFLRVPLDRFCRMNLHLPHLADQVGGGLCGFAAGVLAFGMLLNGVNFLPIDRDIMGWEPFSVRGNEIKENQEGRLWPTSRVHEWSGNFFEFLSAGAMSPTGGTPLAEARPNLAQRAILSRAPVDTNQMRTAHPDNVQVIDVHTFPATLANVKALVQRAAIAGFLNKLPPNVNTAKNDNALALAVYADLNNRFTDPEKYGKPEELINYAMLTRVIEEWHNEDAEEYLAKLTEAEGSESAAVVKKELDEVLKQQLAASKEQGFLETFIPDVTDRITQELLYNEDGRANGFAQSLAAEGDTSTMLYVVDTHWKNTKAGTFNQNKLRVALSQVRLQLEDDEEQLAPIGFSIEYSQNTKGRVFTEVVSSPQDVAYSNFQDFHMGLVFMLPPGKEPKRLFLRELRFDLSELAEKKAEDMNLGQIAQVFGTPPLIRIKEVAQDQTGTRIGDTESYAQLTEQLPRSFGKNFAPSIVAEKNSKPWTLKDGSDNNVTIARGGKNNTLREIFITGDVRLVRIAIANQQREQTLYGGAIGLAQRLGVVQLKDTGGNGYNCIGYILVRPDKTMSIDIRDKVAQGGVSASELPRVGQDQKLYLYFQVPINKQINRFVAGTQVTHQFETPLEVTPK